jgi:hypothetical protein
MSLRLARPGARGAARRSNPVSGLMHEARGCGGGGEDFCLAPRACRREAPDVTGCRGTSYSGHFRPGQPAVLVRVSWVRVPPPPNWMGATARHHQQASPQGAELAARETSWRQVAAVSMIAAMAVAVAQCEQCRAGAQGGRLAEAGKRGF